MKELHIIASRPSGIPEDWIVCNAPRPLAGDETWEGEFRHGVFYAALNPTDEFFKLNMFRNVKLDAWRITYHTEEQARACLKALCPRYAHKVDEMKTELVIQSFHQRMNKWT